MKKYKITINTEHEVSGIDEQDAMINFFETIVYEAQSDPATFIVENTKAKEIK